MSTHEIASFKRQADRLREFLAERGFAVSVAQSYEALARAYGAKNWAIHKHKIETSPIVGTAVIRFPIIDNSDWRNNANSFVIDMRVPFVSVLSASQLCDLIISNVSPHDGIDVLFSDDDDPALAVSGHVGMAFIASLVCLRFANTFIDMRSDDRDERLVLCRYVSLTLEHFYVGENLEEIDFFVLSAMVEAPMTTFLAGRHVGAIEWMINSPNERIFDDDDQLVEHSLSILRLAQEFIESFDDATLRSIHQRVIVPTISVSPERP